MLLTKIILLALSAVISFIFTGMKTGVFLINRSRIRKQMQAGNNKAHLLFNLKNEVEKFYMTVLLGSTITKGVLTAVLVLLLKEISSGVLFWSLFLTCVFILFTFCDLLPKKLFSRFPDKLCLTFARSFQFAQFPFALFVGLVQTIFGKKLTKIIKQPSAKRLFRNREELKKLMEDLDEGLNDEERNMINQVLRLSERTLGQVAIPLNLSVTASAASPISSIIDLCRNHRIARVPIWKYGGGQRKVIGIVTLKTSLYREDYDCKKPASEYMQPALFLPADLKVEAALTRMQRSGHWLAIVTSKSHKEAGVVALQDILNVVCSENPKK
jgi:CBS domain containing-hemolysin-like protein